MVNLYSKCLHRLQHLFSAQDSEKQPQIHLKPWQKWIALAFTTPFVPGIAVIYGISYFKSRKIKQIDNNLAISTNNLIDASKGKEKEHEKVDVEPPQIFYLRKQIAPPTRRASPAINENGKGKEKEHEKIDDEPESLVVSPQEGCHPKQEASRIEIKNLLIEIINRGGNPVDDEVIKLINVIYEAIRNIINESKTPIEPFLYYLNDTQNEALLPVDEEAIELINVINETILNAINASKISLNELLYDRDDGQNRVLLISLLAYALREKNEVLVKNCLQIISKVQMDNFLKKYGDITILLRQNPTDEAVVVHSNKALLSYHSEVFRIMFFGAPMREAEASSIEIGDIDPSIFDSFLQGVHYGEVSISIKNYAQLLAIAHRFEAHDLVYACEQWIMSHLNGFDTEELVEFADDFHLFSVQKNFFLTLLRSVESGQEKDIQALNKLGRNITEFDFQTSLKWLCKWLNDSALKILIQACPNLQKLVLVNCKKITDEGLQAIAPHLTQLQELSIFQCEKITDEGLQAIAPHLRQLRKLDLHSTSISDKGLRAIAPDLPQLRELVLTSTNISGEGLRVLAEHSKQLRELTLCTCKNISGTDWQAAVPYLTQLRKLDLSYTSITDDDLQATASYLTQLRKLDLHSTSISDNGLRAIAPYLPQLRELNLTCTSISGEGLKVLAEHSKQLRRLDLSECPNISDEGLKAFAEHSNQLRILNLTSCNKISDAGFQAIAHFTHLRELDLTRTSISDEALTIILKHSKQLRKLNLTRTSISDEGLNAIGKHSQQLRELDLSWCKKISDAGIQAIAAHLTQLRRLHLINCDTLSDMGLQAVSHLTRLLHLNLRRTKVSDTCLLAIAQHLTQLRVLHLSRDANITDEGLQAIANRLKKCEVLRINPR